MTTEEIVATAREILTSGRAVVLATVDQQGMPQMRWMGGVVVEEPLTVYLVAGAQSRKMHQIQAHPHAQVLAQDEGFARVVTCSGGAELVQDADVKKRVWDGMPGAARFFSGPDDPNLGVLAIKVARVELLAIRESHSPLVAQL